MQQACGVLSWGFAVALCAVAAPDSHTGKLVAWQGYCCPDTHRSVQALSNKDTGVSQGIWKEYDMVPDSYGRLFTLSLLTFLGHIFKRSLLECP